MPWNPGAGVGLGDMPTSAMRPNGVSIAASRCIARAELTKIIEHEIASRRAIELIYYCRRPKKHHGRSQRSEERYPWE